MSTESHYMRPNAWKAVLGGFLGTMAMTVIMLALQPMELAAVAGQSAGWWPALLVHLINGSFLFPLLYVLLAYPVLAGPPWLRGSTWGVTLWFVAQVAIMPLLGAGFFSTNAGGLTAVIASLLGHLVYGTFLGAVAGPGRELAARAPRARSMAA
jgi:uncharacterized membrane protein YagU involved in acid resistance